MDYVELNIAVSDSETAEILTAELSELPFESFVAERGTLKAYIPQSRLVDCKEDADEILHRYGITDSRYVQIEAQNWNALWESNFEPVDVDGRAMIRAPFHPARPDCDFEIVIMPKMSFGTGASRHDAHDGRDAARCRRRGSPRTRHGLRNWACWLSPP